MKRIIIVTVLIILLALSFIAFNFWDEITKKQYTKEEAISVMDKFYELNNVHIKIVSESSSQVGIIRWVDEGYRKGKYELRISHRPTSPEENYIYDTKFWYDSETGEVLALDLNHKTYQIVQRESQKTNTFWDEFDCDYEFVGYDSINGVRCIVIKFIQKNSDDSITEYNMWIDKTKGTTLKEYRETSRDGYVYDIETITVEVEYNKVTDKDVEKPSLEGYSEYKNESDSNNLNNEI